MGPRGASTGGDASRSEVPRTEARDSRRGRGEEDTQLRRTHQIRAEGEVRDEKRHGEANPDACRLEYDCNLAGVVSGRRPVVMSRVVCEMPSRAPRQVVGR